MGSFNVACGISNLSISSGEKVVFIPLIPPSWVMHKSKISYADNIGKVPSANLIGVSAFFNPLCLPIKGTYDDYGGVENIKGDTNISVIEDFFKVSAKNLISIATRRESVNNSFSTLYHKFAVNKKILNIGAVSFGVEFLEGLSFKVIKNNIFKYTLEELPFDIYFKETKKYFVVKVLKGKKVLTSDKYNKNSIDNKIKFLLTFFNTTEYHLNVSKDNQEIVNTLSSISGMFILREVYDNIINQDISKFVGFYNDLEKLYNDSRKVLKKEVEKANKFDWELSYSLCQLFDCIFRDWPYFLDLYKNQILDNSIKQNIIEYIKLKIIMFSSNHFFFPTMNGEQFGNDKASEFINNISTNILKKRLHTCHNCGMVDHEGIYVISYKQKVWSCKACLEEV